MSYTNNLPPLFQLQLPGTPASPAWQWPGEFFCQNSTKTRQTGDSKNNGDSHLLGHSITLSELNTTASASIPD